LRDPRQLGLRDRQSGLGLGLLPQNLGIVDLEKQLSGCHVLAAGDRTSCHTAVDTRSDVDADRPSLALDQHRLRLDQVPERQAEDDGNDQSDDEGRGYRRRAGRVLLSGRRQIGIFRRARREIGIGDHVIHPFRPTYRITRLLGYRFAGRVGLGKASVMLRVDIALTPPAGGLNDGSAIS
jgi:hypothetical protein